MTLSAHADAELLADGEAASPARPALEAPLPDLDGLGVKALRASARNAASTSRGVSRRATLLTRCGRSAPAVAAGGGRDGLAAPALRCPKAWPSSSSSSSAKAHGGRALAAQRGHEQVPARRDIAGVHPAAYAALSAASAASSGPHQRRLMMSSARATRKPSRRRRTISCRAIPHQVPAAAWRRCASTRWRSFVRRRTSSQPRADPQAAATDRAAPKQAVSGARRRLEETVRLAQVRPDTGGRGLRGLRGRRGLSPSGLARVYARGYLRGHARGPGQTPSRRTGSRTQHICCGCEAPVYQGGHPERRPADSPSRGAGERLQLRQRVVPAGVRCAKSAQYCRVSSGAAAVLCLAEVAVGDPLLKRAPDHNSNNARRLSGKDSVVAMGS